FRGLPLPPPSGRSALGPAEPFRPELPAKPAQPHVRTATQADTVSQSPTVLLRSMKLNETLTSYEDYELLSAESPEEVRGSTAPKRHRHILGENDETSH